MDLLDSARPFYVLLGRRRHSTSGLHGSRAIGTYSRIRRLRVGAGSTSIPEQPGHLTYLLGASRSDNVSRIALPLRNRQSVGDLHMSLIHPIKGARI
jgi:hypothetical protein